MVKKLKPLVLIVEDDKSIASVTKYNLEKSDFTVHITNDGEDAIDVAQDLKPDVILLDWLLPSKQGIDVCRVLRSTLETKNIPIIMVSSKGDDFDKVTGLDIGADDYIVKPFSPPELISRINAVLRRIRPAFSAQTLEFEDVSMDLSAHKVTRNDIEIDLAPIEFQILQMLMEHPKKVMSRDNLIDKVWGPDVYVSPRTVDVHITRLRKALLCGNDKKTDIIKTVRLAGYILRSSKQGGQ